jgi:hypothetical protein
VRRSSISSSERQRRGGGDDDPACQVEDFEGAHAFRRGMTAAQGPGRGPPSRSAPHVRRAQGPAVARSRRRLAAGRTGSRPRIARRRPSHRPGRSRRDSQGGSPAVRPSRHVCSQAWRTASAEKSTRISRAPVRAAISRP